MYFPLDVKLNIVILRAKGEVICMAEVGVVLRNDEEFDRALKRFKKVFERAGVIKQVKSQMYFEKPSEEKKKRVNTQKRRIAKENRILSR